MRLKLMKIRSILIPIDHFSSQNVIANFFPTKKLNPPTA
jgi:hypothetical protein